MLHIQNFEPLKISKKTSIFQYSLNEIIVIDSDSRNNSWPQSHGNDFSRIFHTQAQVEMN